MKLATYKDGSRDGQLVVVSRDLALAHFATGSATRLQQALDDWNFVSPQLQDLYVTLNQGKARHAFPFEPRQCMAPLPRAYQWVDASPYLPHLERLHRSPGGDLPEALRTEPLMRQGASDGFLGPCDDAWFADPDGGIDFGAGLAAVTGDVPMGAGPEQALDGVRLLMLVTAWRLHHLAGTEPDRGFGRLQGQPAAAFGPVAVTPDELGDAWQGGRVHLTLQSACNGRKLGLNDAAPDMQFHFGQLVAHLARTRHVRAGSIVGAGPVSNADAAKGFGCLAEKRAVESIERGDARTPYLAVGDRVRIEMKGRDGLSVFGAIDQQVAGPVAQPAADPAGATIEAPASDPASGPAADLEGA